MMNNYVNVEPLSKMYDNIEEQVKKTAMQICQKIFLDTKDYVHNQCLEMISEHNEQTIQPEYKEYKKQMNDKHLKVLRSLDRIDDLQEKVNQHEDALKSKAEEGELQSLSQELHSEYCRIEDYNNLDAIVKTKANFDNLMVTIQDLEQLRVLHQDLDKHFHIDINKVEQ